MLPTSIVFHEKCVVALHLKYLCKFAQFCPTPIHLMDYGYSYFLSSEAFDIFGITTKGIETNDKRNILVAVL